jgi:hypothetical protein
MRKILCTVFMLLAVAAAGFAPAADAASGLPSNCTYKCSCSGTPLKCCTSNGVQTCKVTGDIACPQVYTC